MFLLLLFLDFPKLPLGLKICPKKDNLEKNEKCPNMRFCQCQTINQNHENMHIVWKQPKKSQLIFQFWYSLAMLNETFLGIFKHHVQVKITCEKANITQMDEVTHQLSKQNFQIKYFYIRQSEFPILYNDFFMDLDINHLSFFDSSKETQCLKITQNVSFQFFNFGIFHQLKMCCLVTLFDCKL